MNTTLQENELNQRDNASHHSTKKNVLKWLVFILFPITAISWRIWFKYNDRIKKPWRGVLKVLNILLSIRLVVIKISVCVFFLIVGLCEDFAMENTTHDGVPEPTYITGDDFLKLTGVEFPELELIDSLHYDDGFPTSANWNEYKFVGKDNLTSGFYQRLDEACQTDSTHWNKNDEGYNYHIHPDLHPVDRSRGMCDRQVQLNNGEWVNDWDGTFVSVDIQNDTITLREGWVR